MENWDYPDYYDSDEWVHKDNLKKYDDAKEWIEETLHHVYNTGNIDELEIALDELTAIFDIKIPSTLPKLKRKQSDLFNLALDLSNKQ